MTKGRVFILSAVLSSGIFPKVGNFSADGEAAGENVMKIDSIAAFTGQQVNIPVRVTNEVSVGGLDVRFFYDVLAESLHSVTIGERLAGWQVFESFPDTAPGEIHIVAFADDNLPPDSIPIVLPAGSGPVAYLNFKIYAPSIFEGSFTEVRFSSHDTLDNIMYDSAGNLVGQDNITYVNGGIDLRSTGVAERGGNRPGGVWLGQNFPNPFNPPTAIEFKLAASGHVRLTVYDLLGRTVAVLLDEVAAAGEHRVLWDGRDEGGQPVSSGAYFYRLLAGEGFQTKKMILVK